MPDTSTNKHAATETASDGLDDVLRRLRPLPTRHRIMFLGPAWALVSSIGIAPRVSVVLVDSMN